MTDTVKQIISSKRILTMEVSGVMIDKGYTSEFINWLYERTDKFDGYHKDMEWIADALDNSVAESLIRNRLIGAHKIG